MVQREKTTLNEFLLDPSVSKSTGGSLFQRTEVVQRKKTTLKELPLDRPFQATGGSLFQGTNNRSEERRQRCTNFFLYSTEKTWESQKRLEGNGVGRTGISASGICPLGSVGFSPSAVPVAVKSRRIPL